MRRCIGSLAAVIVGALLARFLRFSQMSRSCKERASAITTQAQDVVVGAAQAESSSLPRFVRR
jgi:hypothetical protein